MNKSMLKERYGEAAAFIIKYKRRFGGKLPWTDAYGNMRSRCKGYNERDRRSYGGRKVCVTSAELRELFYRDHAWKFKVPSADRIDPDADYRKDNIRWVEWTSNRTMRYMTARPDKYAEGKKMLVDFFQRCGWKKHLRISFLNTVSRELRADDWV